MKHAQRYLISYLQEYITKCVGSAIQMSLLFLGVNDKIRGFLLADTICNKW